MANKAGVWIDHKKAVVILISDQGEGTKLLKSNVPRPARSGGGPRVKGSYTRLTELETVDTVHASTNDQTLIDAIHNDPQRARSTAQNIIRTTTGAARAVGVVIPDLAGKLTGIALRVPVACGSITDLTVTLNHSVTRKEVNAAFSCIFDASWTQDSGKLLKVLGWYDNEWSYSVRSADVLKLMATTRAL